MTGEAIVAQSEMIGACARAFEIMADTCGLEYEPHRELTDEEMNDLAYCLTYALMKLRKLPRGHDAVEAMYEKLKAELARRTASKDVVGT